MLKWKHVGKKQEIRSETMLLAGHGVIPDWRLLCVGTHKLSLRWVSR